MRTVAPSAAANHLQETCGRRVVETYVSRISRGAKWLQLGSWGGNEHTTIDRLSAAYRQLLRTEAGHIDTRSEAGLEACTDFFNVMDSAANSLRLRTASRTYREAFALNYRQLFTRDRRLYHMDVFEGSLEPRSDFWVNGERYQLSEEVARLAEELQSTWAFLGKHLCNWSLSSSLCLWKVRPLLSDVIVRLVDFDYAWAMFEQKYIEELIAIEELARGMVAQAIEHERRLRWLEARHGLGYTVEQVQRYREERSRLVSCLARLNAVANVRRKGRDDLGASILDAALAALRIGSGGGWEQAGVDPAAAAASATHARLLAADVVGSFTAMRQYLHQVSEHLDDMDPNLRNNPGLVDRLEDWEECWELGSRFVQDPAVFRELCDVLAMIKDLQVWLPHLRTMCEECDVELFLVLPRLLWLAFLRAPSSHWRLPRLLLPQHFAGLGEGCGSELLEDGALATFRACFDSLLAPRPQPAHQPAPPPAPLSPAPLSPLPHRSPRSLASGGPEAVVCVLGEDVVSVGTACSEDVDNGAGRASQAGPGQPAIGGPPPTDDVTRLSWQGIVRWAVTGERPDRAPEELAALEELMRQLEYWSMQLQRHCPEDWNQLSAVLVRCLTDGQQLRGESPKPAFRV